MVSVRFIPLALIGFSLVVAGCGDDSESSTTASVTGAAGIASAASADAFPVTIRHAQGSATIEAPPERVVALGAADVQIARALGANVVGAAKNDYRKDGEWLGVEPPLGDSVTRLHAIEPNVEQIARLRPDLILITAAQPSFSAAYEVLSKIAPVVSYDKGLLEDNGEDLVRTIGQALGRSEQAEQLIADSRKQLRDFAKEHPELRGKRIAVGQAVGGQTYLVVSHTAPSTALLEGIGMKLPAPIARLPVRMPPGVTVLSDENLGLLDSADHVLLGIASEAEARRYLDEPLVSRLDVATAGNLDFVDFNEATLLVQPNPASTGAVLDILERELKGG